MESLKKSELIEKVAASTGETKASVDRLISSLQEEIVSAVASGKKVQLTGFASFEPRERAARKGRNPSTGDEIEIPAKTVVSIKPLGKFKDAL